jgi:hypothetical protein
MPPNRGALTRQLHIPLPRDRRWKPRVPRNARRRVLVQCAECGASATGNSFRGRLASTQLPTTYGYRKLTHSECGGELVGFDIFEDDDR